MSPQRVRRPVYSAGDCAGGQQVGCSGSRSETQTDSTLSSDVMQCGSIVLSLLLLATVCHAQLGIGAGAALAAGIAGVGALGVLGGAAAALSLRGRR